jgi:hypothetical protein
VSGGGGWGIKQGLLSLDPEITHGSNQESPLQFHHGFSPKDEQSQALGEVAKPGDYIQFFIPGDAMPEAPLVEEANSARRESSVFGTIPSSVDDLPPTISAEETSQLENFVAVPGHFGALTEQGIYLSLVRPKDTQLADFKTKIDIPFTRFIQNSTRPIQSREVSSEN